MKFNFFSRNNEVRSYFGLFLKSQEGIGMAINNQNGQFTVADQVKFKYSNGWENLSQDVDEVILRLENRTRLKLDDTIVFVFSHFIDAKTGQIKQAYTSILKDLFKNLELKPLGYIECYEAVTKFLEERDGIPLTSILIELDSTELSVVIYKGGKIVEKKTVASTSQIIEDIKTCFSAMPQSIMPSRIVLYNSHNLNDQATKIVTYRWSEDLFVQPPRVEIISEEDMIDGLITIFKEQIVGEKSVGDFTIESEQQAVTGKTVEGFLIGADVANSSQIPQPANKNSETKKFEIVAKVSEIKQRLFSFAKNLARPKLPMPLYGLLGMIFIVTALFLNEYFFHKAQITVFVESRQIEKNVTVASSSLNIEIATEEAQFSQSQPTTGKRDVGEKAKGQVTLHNFEDRDRTFAKGILLSADNLNFVLQDEVKVASASETTVGGNLVKQPGKAAATILAQEIGQQSNLAKGKRFKIDDLSSSVYFAINETALSGGTKRQVNTVAKSDTEALKNKVLAKAKKQELEKIKKQKTDNIRIIDELTQVIISDLKYSKEIGEESDDISLNATTKTVYYFYNKDELVNILTRELSRNLDSGFALDKSKLNYSIGDIDNKNEQIELVYKVVGKALKEISTQKLTLALLLKDDRKLEEILKKDFSADGFTLKNDQPLPILKHTMPLFPKNISLQITSYK